MKIKAVKVISFSPTGDSKKVAETIAKGTRNLPLTSCEHQLHEKKGVHPNESYNPCGSDMQS